MDCVVSSNCPWMSSDVSISTALTTARSRYDERRTFKGPDFPADAVRESNANACTGVRGCVRASVTADMCHPQLDGCLINGELAAWQMKMKHNDVLPPKFFKLYIFLLFN
jgi:hypothetical protein